MALRTYRKQYADAAKNPTPDLTGGYLVGYYRFAGDGDIPTPAQLRNHTVAMSDCQPVAFLCLVNEQDGVPEVAIVHHLLRFMDSPGDKPSEFHDLIGTPVRVPTIAAMEALIPTWEDPGVPLGAYTEADPETEVICPRNAQLVPGQYAALIISRRRIKASKARGDNKALDSCSDIVVWLRAACTASGGGGAQNAHPSVLHPLAPLHLVPSEVYQYVTQKVQTDLPGVLAPQESHRVPQLL